MSTASQKRMIGDLVLVEAAVMRFELNPGAGTNKESAFGIIERAGYIPSIAHIDRDYQAAYELFCDLRQRFYNVIDNQARARAVKFHQAMGV